MRIPPPVEDNVPQVLTLIVPTQIWTVRELADHGHFTLLITDEGKKPYFDYSQWYNSHINISC